LRKSVQNNDCQSFEGLAVILCRKMYSLLLITVGSELTLCIDRCLNYSSFRVQDMT